MIVHKSYLAMHVLKSVQLSFHSNPQCIFMQSKVASYIGSPWAPGRLVYINHIHPYHIHGRARGAMHAREVIACACVVGTFVLTCLSPTNIIIFTTDLTIAIL